MQTHKHPQPQPQLRTTSNISTNSLKQNLYPNIESLQKHRIYIEEDELQEYWQTLTLIEMEQILTIVDQKLVEHIWSYISYFITHKINQSIRNAYVVREGRDGGDGDGRDGRDGQSVMWCYDCRIFKNSSLYTKEENQYLGAFMVRYKNISKSINQDKSNGHNSSPKLQRDSKTLYQFINPEILQDKEAIFKCKASYLLKIFSLFKSAYLQPVKGDVMILTQDLYFKFIYNWTHFSYSWQVQPMVLHLFKGLLILIQNQIMLHFFRSLSQNQKQFRRYNKPVLILQKPKLKSASTMIEQGLGDVEWSTLRIPAYKIKYRVVEQKDCYLCYRVKQEQFDHFDINMHNKLNMHELNVEDQNIVMAFDKIKSSWQKVDHVQY